jgi:hypothetical protein
LQVPDQGLEPSFQCRAPPNQDKIITPSSVPGHKLFRCRPETPPGPVAIHRAADFAADGKSDSISARFVPVIAPVFADTVHRFSRPMGTGLKNQTRCHPLVPGALNAQKLATLFQP